MPDLGGSLRPGVSCAVHAVRREAEPVALSVEENDDVIAAVRRAIAACLPNGNPAIHRVAHTVGINARTLQRRLANHHLTYRRLVDDVRLQTACRMLETNCRMPVGEVSKAVGYSDPAHFTRAFVRWTGMTPREYHRRIRDNRP